MLRIAIEKNMRYDRASEAAYNAVRVRRLQGPTQSAYGRSAFRDRQARSGVQSAVRAQSSQARSKAEAETRFPRSFRLSLSFDQSPRFRLPPDQFGVVQPFVYDLGKKNFEAVEIVRILSIVIAENLLVNVCLQMAGNRRLRKFPSGCV